MQIKQTLVVFLSASLLELGSAASYCTTRDLIHMDVTSCTCHPQNTGCSSTCQECNTPVTKHIHSCTGGCQDSEAACTACGIWFHSLCDCLQHPASCTTSGKIERYGNPVWALLETAPHDDNLITTTEFLPGILQMGPTHDEAWIFSQANYKPASQALAINPVKVRTMEQIHVHVCNRNTTTGKMLAKETMKSSSNLVQLAGNKEMYCRWVNHGATVKGLSADIANFLANLPPGVCRDMVGAAIIQDNNGRVWACATTNHYGPLAIVCHK